MIPKTAGDLLKLTPSLADCLVFVDLCDRIHSSDKVLLWARKHSCTLQHFHRLKEYLATNRNPVTLAKLQELAEALCMDAPVVCRSPVPTQAGTKRLASDLKRMWWVSGVLEMIATGAVERGTKRLKQTGKSVPSTRGNEPMMKRKLQKRVGARVIGKPRLLEDRILRYEQNVANIKAAWDDIEAEEAAIIKGLAGKSLLLPDGRTAEAQDNFVDPATGKPRNFAFRAARVKRIELRISKARSKKKAGSD